MDESYTFERVDNGWLVKFKNPQSSHYTEVFQDSDLYEDEDMTATESLHDALRNIARRPQHHFGRARHA